MTYVTSHMCTFSAYEGLPVFHRRIWKTCKKKKKVILKDILDRPEATTHQIGTIKATTIELILSSTSTSSALEG